MLIFDDSTVQDLITGMMESIEINKHVQQRFGSRRLNILNSSSLTDYRTAQERCNNK
jgi:hypothetical protein